jgi:preprotein translocase subunit SecE
MAGIKTYIEESYNELVHKVTWPTWRELQESTILVFVTLFILAVLIFAMDFAFGVKGLIGLFYSLLT